MCYSVRSFRTPLHQKRCFFAGCKSKYFYRDLKNLYFISLHFRPEFANVRKKYFAVQKINFNFVSINNNYKITLF